MTARRSTEQVCGRLRSISAKLYRLDIAVYGFRVAEPRRDGTPHRHFLIFPEPLVSEQVQAVLRPYALQANGDEPGKIKEPKAFQTVGVAVRSLLLPSRIRTWTVSRRAESCSYGVRPVEKLCRTASGP